MYMFSRRRNLFPEEEILFLIDNKHIVSFIWQVMKFPFELFLFWPFIQMIQVKVNPGDRQFCKLMSVQFDIYFDKWNLKYLGIYSIMYIISPF